MTNTTFKENLFESRTAVVTGGTSGIGAATAIYLAELGAKVYALGLQAKALKIPHGLDIIAVEVDVTNESSIRSFFTELKSLDILFNAAGISPENQFDYEVFKKVIDINMNSVFLVSDLARPLLAKSNMGSIINVSSMMAIFGSGQRPAYSTGKAGVDLITKSLSIAYAEDNIRVNAVAPGWIATRILDGLKTEKMDLIIGRTPMKRLGQPIEIAQIVAFLASPAASFVNGAILSVDGGYSTT